MALDVYAPCPCGSGKKLKFCCQTIADDMDRISRLIENNQSRQALHLLDALLRKHPDNAWGVTTQALVQLEDGAPGAARDGLRGFLERHPEHEFATVLYAMAVLQGDGLDAARKPVHRALQRGAKKFPGMVAGLAGGMAYIFQLRGQMLAAREHLALAMRFAPDKQRQDVFVRLIEFDSEESTPYPLRSVHPLPPISGSNELAGDVKKALKYAAVGCWDTSAEILSKLAETHADNAELWHCIGLCLAWDGQEPAAATALHRAAQLYADRGTAVECETLAQLIEIGHSPQRRELLRLRGIVTSVSRLLSQFDTVPRLHRTERPPQESTDEPLPAAIYQVLDRPLSECPPPHELTTETVPLVLAQVIIYDADPESKEPAEAILTGLAGPEFDRVSAMVREVGGDIVTWDDAAEKTGQWVPEEMVALNWRWCFQPYTPLVIRRHLELERWRQMTLDVWPQSPLHSLSELAPQVAAQDPAMQTAVLAAVYVLDAYCLRGGHELDVNATIARLGLEPLPQVTVTPETSLNSFTTLQWLRLPLQNLTDQQMLSAVNRALLLHHDRFLYDALRAAVERPSCLEEIDQTRVYQTLADLCRKHGRSEENLRWIAAGRRYAESQPNSFEQIWSWDLRELLVRLENPTDPGFKQLVDKFVHYYTPKLPQTRPYIEEILKAAGVPSPWNTGIVTATAAGPTGGLWTPDSPGEPVAAGKLWLPGQ